MAGTTTYFGISYPTSTDLVKDGALNMQTIATGFDSAVAIPIYNAQTGTTYTFALADIPKTVTASNASAQTYTIPTQATVTWPASATLNVVNLGAGTLSIAGAVGVTLTNSATTLSQYQSASLVRTAENAWTLIPFVGGVSSLSDSAISGTTGTPTTATYTSGGVNYKTYKWTGATGSFTLTRAGTLDIFLVGGGGGSGVYVGAGGGGGAGGIIQQTVYLPAGTCNIVVGAGGASSVNYEQVGATGFATAMGVGTNVWTYVAPGGGGGGAEISAQATARLGTKGASGGGTAGGGGQAGATILLTGMGNVGGNGASAGAGNSSGGGGGYSAAGGNASVGTSGAGGAGLGSTFFDGSTTVYYAGGGGGTGGTQGANGLGGGGTANTGGGARGAQVGGSGIAMIRVRA
jgi:hypothetical protein